MKDLNKLLATTVVFAQKVHNLHWNVEGSDFMVSHKMTDELHAGLLEFIDQLAEKQIMHGKKPFVTLKQYIDNSEIKETDKDTFTAAEVANLIAKDLDTYCKLVVETEVDAFSQPMIDEIILFVDKHRWFFAKTAKQSKY